MQPPSLPIAGVLAKGLGVLRADPGRLLVRASLLMAIPALVIGVRQATDSYWLNMLLWLFSLVLGGYAAWPLSRSVLAAASPGRSGPPPGDDWWVRDGFVRASVAFYLTVAVGIVFLVVPGFMIAMIYGLYPFLIIERRARGFHALALSSDLTRGNRIRLLRLQLVCLLLFVPAGACLYLWNPHPLGVVAFWAVSTPAMAATFSIMAGAYRTLAHPTRR